MEPSYITSEKVRASGKMVEERLDRLEEKIDRVSEAIIIMARMEERQISAFKRMDHLDNSLKRFDERLDDMEKAGIQREQKIAFAERLFWMLLSGAVGLAFIYMR